VLLQTNRQGEMFTLLIPALMLNKRFSGLERLDWKSRRGQIIYRADIISITSPPPPFMDPPRYFAPGPGTSTSRNAIKTPYSVDLRPIGTAVLNQGDLGTCGVSAVISLLEFITGERLSVLFLYWTTRVGLEGAKPHEDAGVELKHCIDAAKRFGVCREEAWPYCIDKFLEKPSEEAWKEAERFTPNGGWLELKSLDEMRHSLAERQVPCFADVFFCPEAYGQDTTRTGRVPEAPNSSWDNSCEHSCVIVGYDDNREVLIFQNAWGSSWGDGGYGFLPYDYLKRGLFRNCYTWEGPLPLHPFTSASAL